LAEVPFRYSSVLQLVLAPWDAAIPSASLLQVFVVAATVLVGPAPSAIARSRPVLFPERKAPHSAAEREPGVVAKFFLPMFAASDQVL
jgi:hypothetical protein